MSNGCLERAFYSLDSGIDVVNFYADVMDPSAGVLLDEAGDGRLLAERKQQLNFRVLELHEDDGDTVLGKIFRLAKNQKTSFTMETFCKPF